MRGPEGWDPFLPKRYSQRNDREFLKKRAGAEKLKSKSGGRESDNSSNNNASNTASDNNVSDNGNYSGDVEGNIEDSSSESDDDEEERIFHTNTTSWLVDLLSEPVLYRDCLQFDSNYTNKKNVSTTGNQDPSTSTGTQLASLDADVHKMAQQWVDSMELEGCHQLLSPHGLRARTDPTMSGIGISIASVAELAELAESKKSAESAEPIPAEAGYSASSGSSDGTSPPCSPPQDALLERKPSENSGKTNTITITKTNKSMKSNAANNSLSPVEHAAYSPGVYQRPSWFPPPPPKQIYAIDPRQGTDAGTDSVAGADSVGGGQTWVGLTLPPVAVKDQKKNSRVCAGVRLTILGAYN